MGTDFASAIEGVSILCNGIAIPWVYPSRESTEPVTPISGEEALARLRCGDPTALDRLVELHGPGLLAHLRRRVRDPALAEDLFQEVWRRVIERRHQLRDPARFAGWLYRIGTNLAANEGRRRGREVSLDTAFPAEPGGEGGAGAEPPLADSRAASPREAVQAASLAQRLEALVGQLDPTTREMITLRFTHGLTTGEIAEALGTPIGTVCSNVHRGLLRLREACRREGLTLGDLP